MIWIRYTYFYILTIQSKAVTNEVMEVKEGAFFYGREKIPKVV